MLAHGMAMACNKSYRDMIIADGAAYFWDFMDQPKSTAAPAVGSFALNVFGAPPAQQFTQDTKGILLNGSNQAAGVNQGLIASTNCSVETWIKTTNKYGGVFEANTTGTNSNPSSYDKLCFIDANGLLNFGVYNGAIRQIVTTNYVCDGLPHHIVLSMSGSSSTLLVDGVPSGTINYVSNDPGHSPVFGYVAATAWNNYVSPYLNGLIACPAIYNFAMPDDMAKRHYVAGL